MGSMVAVSGQPGGRHVTQLVQAPARDCAGLCPLKLITGLLRSVRGSTFHIAICFSVDDC
jgi:hypothetical protein